jgi:hypothetical protein
VARWVPGLEPKTGKRATAFRVRPNSRLGEILEVLARIQERKP